MKFSTSNPIFNFHFKPNFDKESIYCAFEIQNKNNYKNYFHYILNPSKIKATSKPFVYFENNVGKKNIFYLNLYNVRLIYRSEWHYELISVYDSVCKNSENTLIGLFTIFISLFGVLIAYLNILFFKFYSFYKLDSIKDTTVEMYGVYNEWSKVDEKFDDMGRTIFLKERYFSNHEYYVREISYDLENNTYTEISINPYDDKKYKLVVYPYFDDNKKPKWYKSFKESWQCCMVFEVKTEDRLMCVLSKTNYK